MLDHSVKDSLTAAQRRWLVAHPLRPALTKEEAPCCVARRDKLGRLPIGWCSRGCVRRPVAA